MNQRVVIDYTNHKGVRSTRLIHPMRIVWGSSEWHPQKQWLLDAFDVDKQLGRTFAMSGIHGWEPVGVPGA